MASVKTAEILTVIMGLLKLICYASGTLIIHKYGTNIFIFLGRKKPALFGTIIVSIILFLLGTTVYLYDHCDFNN